VHDRLENTVDWDKTQKEQFLGGLIQKIERICIGFKDYK
jgi:hypothetical protein